MPDIPAIPAMDAIPEPPPLVPPSNEPAATIAIRATQATATATRTATVTLRSSPRGVL
jgi:hypothetical protein